MKTLRLLLANLSFLVIVTGSALSQNDTTPLETTIVPAEKKK